MAPPLHPWWRRQQHQDQAAAEVQKVRPATEGPHLHRLAGDGRRQQLSDHCEGGGRWAVCYRVPGEGCVRSLRALGE